MLAFGEGYVGSFPETYNDPRGVGHCFYACTRMGLEKPCIIKGVGMYVFCTRQALNGFLDNMQVKLRHYSQSKQKS